MMKVEFQAENLETLIAQIVQYLGSIKGINMVGNGGRDNAPQTETDQTAD